MLVRKKLAALPVKPLPKGIKAGANDKYYAMAAVHTVGGDEIIAIDIYTLNKKLFCRFFSDKKNYITLEVTPLPREWNTHKLSTVIGDYGSYSYYTPRCKSPKPDRTIAYEYFEHTWSWNAESAVSIAASWQDKMLYRKRETARDREQERQKEHLSWFKFENDIQPYVDRLTPHYAFMGKSVNKERKVYCTICGGNFTVSSKAFRHKERGLCGLCGGQVIYFKSQYESSIGNKINICEIQKHEDRILIRWEKVTKNYYDGEGRYRIEPFHWYISKPGQYSEKAWAYKAVKQHGTSWVKRTGWRAPYEECYLFHRNLAEAAEADTYIEQVFKDRPSEFNVFKLIEHYKERPQMEYLIKLGLTKLASDPGSIPENARNFTDITGVSKQLLVLYQKYNVTPNENELIKNLDFFVNEEMFRKIRAIGFSADKFRNVTSKYLDGKFGDRKIINYIYKYGNKQTPYSYCDFTTLYRDYVSMLTQLGLRRETVSDYLPSDLRREHDRLADRVNKTKNEILNKEFKEVLPRIYRNIPMEFENDKYCIVLPQSAEDFAKEGQALKICVGGSTYINKHKTGKSLICFIRKTEDRDKAYVCCEIDMVFQTVVQIHGYMNDANKPLPSDVKQFAKKYAAAIKKSIKEDNANGERNRNNTAA